MKLCQLLIAIHCFLKMLPIREGMKSFFDENKHDYVNILFIVLIVCVETNSNLPFICTFFWKQILWIYALTLL